MERSKTDMGSVIFYFLLPILLRACCVRNQRRITPDLRKDITHERYRAVEAEIFMMPCLGPEKTDEGVTWSRMSKDGKHLSFECGMNFVAETQHSGQYTCLTCDRNWSFHLQVLERKSLGCYQPEDSAKYLLANQGGNISCPGLSCSDNADVIWYKMKQKGIRAVSAQRRGSCEHSGWLQLCGVSTYDTGVYFCDRQTTDNWIFRRAVNVTVVPYYTPIEPPKIMYPDGNLTEEVELGEPHTLECRIHFPIDIMRTHPPEVQWYMNHNMGKTPRVLMDSQQLANNIFKVVKVTQRAVIEEVTPQHLHNTYTCTATNINGSSTVTIRLKQRHKVKWPSLVQYPIGPLLLVAGLGIILHMKWLELQLIFRSYFQFGNHSRAEKEFDVFLSFVWPRKSSPSPPGTHDEGCTNSNLLNWEKGGATERPLEALLPQVLEEWGHRLCLLERDVLPGGVYANDVVLSIQRSRMLICVLSADYLSNTDAVFILESGIQALLLKSTPKLLLIWTNKASADKIKPDPPLPLLVQKALKVLPSLDWTSGNSERRTGDFWRSLKKLLPSDNMSGY
eukprot:XP_011608360.1 PREDICTED: interleukin-18 receptor accessory protein isoform X2 [Takifugu rubripes]